MTMTMHPDEIQLTRRQAMVRVLTGAIAAATPVIALSTTAEARPKWGNPPGWSRGRKRGWRKRGGPKWRF